MRLLARSRAGRQLVAAQEASWRGRHEQAERLFVAAARSAPELPHVALQEALAAARAGRLEPALQRFSESAARETAVYRLFHGWLLARLGRREAALARLEPVVREQPDNRVAATALAYALLRDNRPGEALALLQAGPSDNFEVLAPAWLELERTALRWRLHDLPAPPPDAGVLDAAAARRWYRAGVAAAMEYTNSLWRRRLVRLATRERPARLPRLVLPLLNALEQRWPTDPLRAFLAVRASGHDFAELAFHLGAQLYEEGHYSAALDELERAWAAMAESPEAYLPGIYRAAALVELRRWPEATEALAEVARREADELGEDAGQTHEFGQPHWFKYRARVRLAAGDERGALADFNRALAGEPAIFDERLAQLVALAEREGLAVAR